MNAKLIHNNTYFIWIYFNKRPIKSNLALAQAGMFLPKWKKNSGSACFKKHLSTSNAQKWDIFLQDMEKEVL